MGTQVINTAPLGSIQAPQYTEKDGITYLVPGTPSAGLIRMYFKIADHIGYTKDSTGTERAFVMDTATQTLTNKTLTSPAINTPTISGGTINNAAIGGVTPAAGTFTTLTANTSLTTPIWKPSADSTTALKITKADGATAIITIDTTNGVIGIGTTAVTPNLINAAVAPSDGTVNNIVFNASHSLTNNADTTASQRVLNFVATMAGSGGASTGGLIGIIGDVRNNQTAGTWGSIEGFNATIRNQNASTLALARAFDAIQIISGAGSVTTSDLFQARSPSLTSTGGMTTHRGFHANNLGNSLIATSIAFHADTQTGSTNNIYMLLGTTAPTGDWAIHATTASNSALAGKLTIGATSAPGSILDVIQATLGNSVQRLISTATNDDPTESVYQNRVTTTDATVTTLHTFTVPASTTYAIEAIVVARRTGGASGTAEDGARYRISAVYKNVAGTATIIGVVTVLADESQAGWDATFDTTGATVRVRVTGAASNDVVWHVTARAYPVGT